MSMGVTQRSQKCLYSACPQLLQGVIGASQKCHCCYTPASFGANEMSQKCLIICAPREGFNIQTHVMPTTCQSFPNNLQGVILVAQQCQWRNAPTIFIWCQGKTAEMLLLLRTQGKGQDTFAEMPCNKRPSQPVTEANSRAQKCHQKDASQGKGQSFVAEMLLDVHPSQPV